MVDFEDVIQGSNSFYNNNTAQFRLLWTIKEYEKVKESCINGTYITSKFPVNVMPDKCALTIRLYPKGTPFSPNYTSVFLCLKEILPVWISFGFALIAENNVETYSKYHGLDKLESERARGFVDWISTDDFEAEIGTNLPNGCLQILVVGMVWCEEPINKETADVRNFHDCSITSTVTLHQGETQTDAILSVGEGKFQVHKSILTSKSSVFKKMFEESSQNIIVIPDAREEVFQEVIHYMYTNTVTAMTDTVLSEVLPLAKKYELNYLAEICQLKMSKNLRVDNCLEYLKVADSCGASDLKEETLKYITRKRKLVSENPQWDVFESQSRDLHIQLCRSLMKMD